MTAPTRESLKEEIRTAFGSVPFPAHQGLRGSMALDDWASAAEAQAITAEQDIRGEWWQIPKNELRKCSLALSYLDPAGVAFYLPAYLDLALDDVGDSRLWVLDLMDTTRDYDDDEPTFRAWRDARLSWLNDEQRRVCARVMQFLRLQLIGDLWFPYESKQIEGILDHAFWRRAAHDVDRS